MLKMCKLDDVMPLEESNKAQSAFQTLSDDNIATRVEGV
jgi:hypothetical protein